MPRLAGPGQHLPAGARTSPGDIQVSCFSLKVVNIGLSIQVLGASVVSTLALAKLWELYTDCGDTGPVAAARKKVFKLLR